MSLLDDFARVSRSRLCPVCGRPDWCLVSRDTPPSRAVCSRTPSPVRWGEAGWMHHLGPDLRLPDRPVRRALAVRTVPDLAAMAARLAAAAVPERVARLAVSLGLTPDSLYRLGIGWDGRAWAFPMSDSTGRVRGIRLRYPDGSKLAVKGGREGLFVPIELTGDGPLLACEGPTDCAAMLDLGFDCVGRPSCTGGTALVVGLVRRRRPCSVVVVADADEPGRRGAGSLAAVLATYCRDVRVVTPPAKDAREWVRGGATRADVLAAINAAEPLRLGLEIRRAGR